MQYMRTYYSGYKIALDMLDTWYRLSVEDRGQIAKYGKVDERAVAKVPRRITDGFSDLKKWLLEFLRWKDLKNEQTALSRLHSIDGLLQRRLYDLYMPLVTKLQSQFMEAPLESTQEAWFRWQIAHHDYYFVQQGQEAARSNGLQVVRNNLEMCYTLFKTKYMCEELSLTGKPTEAGEVMALIQTCQINQWDTIPIFSCYLRLLQLFLSNEDAIFDSIKQSLQQEKYKQQIAKSERLLLLTYLSNYIAKSARLEKKERLQEVMALYDVGLQEDLYTALGYFAPEIFYNIVQVSCVQKGVSPTHEFIKRWSSALPPAERMDIYAICVARIYYEEHKYEEAIHSLSRDLKFRNPFHHIAARVLLLRCHYELSPNHKLIPTACDAFEKFIQRQKGLPFGWKESTLHFIDVMLVLTSKRIKINKLERLLSLTPIWVPDWVQSKVEEKIKLLQSQGQKRHTAALSLPLAEG